MQGTCDLRNVWLEERYTAGRSQATLAGDALERTALALLYRAI